MTDSNDNNYASSRRLQKDDILSLYHTDSQQMKRYKAMYFSYIIKSYQNHKLQTKT